MRLHNVVVEGINHWDYPKFVDAYISYAEDKDGRKLTDKELENIDYETIQEYVIDKISGLEDKEVI